MSICLSKGLGAPIGSILLGSESLITSAKRWRKVVGGGMRQAGIIAAAAKIALEQNPSKLQQDHNNAMYLAQQLSLLPQIAVNEAHVETNMVFATFSEKLNINQITEQLKTKNILMTAGNPVRFVTHLDINQADIDHFIKALKSILSA